MLSLFEQGTLFGSLIQIPEALTTALPKIRSWLSGQKVSSWTGDRLNLGSRVTGDLDEDMFAVHAREVVERYLRLAELLAQKYDQVVSNPPYMGNKFLSPALKSYLGEKYEGYEKDLFSAFVVRNLNFTKEGGQLGFMSPFVWMFISSYEKLRNKLIDTEIICSLIQLEYSGFDGATVPICTYTLQRSSIRNFRSSFIRLSDFRGAQNQAPKTIEAIHNHNCGWFFTAKPDTFQKIPGRPIAYWVSDETRNAFVNGIGLYEKTISDGQNITADNAKYLRLHWEINKNEMNNNHWIPYAKGGEFRKWQGNRQYLVDWSVEARDFYRKDNSARIIGEYLWFKKGITWTLITSSHQSFRILKKDGTFDKGGSSIFLKNDLDIYYVIALLNSVVSSHLFSLMNSTLNLQVDDVRRIPLIESSNKERVEINSKLLEIQAERDWDAFETSWDFQALPWLPTVLPTYLKDTTIPTSDPHSIASCWDTWRAVGQHWTAEMLRLEEDNNRLFIDAYGLQDELPPEVPIEQITLTVNPWYRYKPRKSKIEATEDDGPGIEVESPEAGDSQPRTWSEEPGAAGTAAGPQIYPEGEARMRADGARELVSYALGCAMGRYSLDEGGLVYAEAGGAGFDGARYRSYPADDDGIVPVTDFKWFEEDAAVRVENFVRTVWGSERHEQNMAWLAEALEAKGTELPLDTLRRYLAGDFYKDHLQTYKKRPIYWKFSSGKEKAFEALVYLHRYHAGTLSRMRMQYVVPLTGQLRKKIDSLDVQIREAASTAERKRLEKEQATLHKKLAELAKFDEELNHYAQLQISLDLDDGVRVNYGKFGGLLANVKDVVGKAEE
jgi:hypothetical protein